MRQKQELEVYDAGIGLNHGAANVAPHQSLSWDGSREVDNLGLAVFPTLSVHLGETSSLRKELISALDVRVLGGL